MALRPDWRTPGSQWGDVDDSSTRKMMPNSIRQKDETSISPLWKSGFKRGENGQNELKSFNSGLMVR